MLETGDLSAGPRDLRELAGEPSLGTESILSGLSKQGEGAVVTAKQVDTFGKEAGR